MTLSNVRPIPPMLPPAIPAQAMQQDSVTLLVIPITLQHAVPLATPPYQFDQMVAALGEELLDAVQAIRDDTSRGQILSVEITNLSHNILVMGMSAYVTILAFCATEILNYHEPERDLDQDSGQGAQNLEAAGTTS